MNKHGKVGCLLFSLLLVLTILMPVAADDKISLAVITRSEPYLVGIGEAKEVSAGRIINKGNVSLTLVAEWVQEEGPRILPITVEPKTLTLEPEEGYEYFIVVGAPDESFFGNYTGYVDVVAKPVGTSSGNPTVPAGGLPLTFIVKHLRPAEWIVYGLQTDNATLVQNEIGYARVSVKNIGEMTGTFNLVARVDGQLLTTIPVTLAGDKTKTLSFLLPTDTAGNHTLTVDGCPDHLTFYVEATEADSNSSVDVLGYRRESGSSNLPYIFLGVIVVAGVAVTSYFKWFRRLKRRTKCSRN